MKVLVLTPGVFDKGGISRYGRFQIRALRGAFGDRAVQVFSLLGRGPGDLEEPFDVDWSGPWPLSGTSRARFCAAALSRAVRFRPDVVLCALLNFGPLAWSVARASGARLVQNIYGLEIWSGPSRLRRAALRDSEMVISDCHNSADAAKALGLVRADPVVVWDCVDLERYTPGPPAPAALERYGLRPASQRLRVLFVGRLDRDSRYKGAERLLRILAGLPAERFEAVIAGKGNDLEYMRDQVRQLKLTDRVWVPGAIHESDLPDLYRSADAFYLTSEVGPGQGEGLPLTPIEAMACGTPVVVGNQDGSREIVAGFGGTCCDPLDLATQASYLSRLAADPTFHSAERAAARARAEAAFGFAAFAEKTVSALSRLKAPR